ncbi:unnamed protein product [Ceratitis capitata]|uniref:(Mediterranean fruit fly) hypothetical protein n=1 Tax=Ceratitis capitata TaxID=7213 RepID=A0A811U115_CERCA|nr:unnamed protein product [Ceratitis capitata]
MLALRCPFAGFNLRQRQHAPASAACHQPPAGACTTSSDVSNLLLYLLLNAQRLLFVRLVSAQIAAIYVGDYRITLFPVSSAPSSTAPFGATSDTSCYRHVIANVTPLQQQLIGPGRISQRSAQQVHYKQPKAATTAITNNAAREWLENISVKC